MTPKAETTSDIRPGEAYVTTSGPINVGKIYFLIHPLTYAPECIRNYKDKERYRAYRECENHVRRRYHEAIDTMAKDEALAVYPSAYPHKDDPHPEELVDIETMARRKLGQRLILCSYPPPQDITYSPGSGGCTSAEFLKLSKAQSLVYDPQTLETEAWGESFDGCVAICSNILTVELGLSKPMEQNFDMCVPDMSWLLKAEFIEKMTLPSKIRFYVFVLQDGRPLAILFQSHLWAPSPPCFVEIPLDPTALEGWEGVDTPKKDTSIAAPHGNAVRFPVTSYYATPLGRGAKCLFARNVDLEAFRAALRQATQVE